MGEYEFWLEQCCGQCEICGVSFSDQVKICIDHCHDSGHVRGLLCGKCNSMLGFARDNARILRQGAVFLEQSYDATRIVDSLLKDESQQGG